jgi:hypothetical protein
MHKHPVFLEGVQGLLLKYSQLGNLQNLDEFLICEGVGGALIVFELSNFNHI